MPIISENARMRIALRSFAAYTHSRDVKDRAYTRGARFDQAEKKTRPSVNDPRIYRRVLYTLIYVYLLYSTCNNVIT